MIFNDLMVDIETLGTNDTGIILSIAAVPFTIGTSSIGSKNIFNVNIDIDSCLKKGLKMDKSTILWWLQQEKSAIDIAFFSETVNLDFALKKFTDFICELKPANLNVWGNSARFDLGILQNAYKKCNREIPWKYSKERDVRTLVALGKKYIKTKTVFKGVKHNPVDDCIYQIDYCNKIYNNLKSPD